MKIILMEEARDWNSFSSSVVSSIITIDLLGLDRIERRVKIERSADNRNRRSVGNCRVNGWDEAR